MIAGVGGRLVTRSFVQAAISTARWAATPAPPVLRDLDAWCERREATLGPASSVRGIADVAVVPLLRLLGYGVGRREDQSGCVVIEALDPAGCPLPVLVVPWNERLDPAWRSAVLHGIQSDARWCICCNGTTLRIVDTHRTWSRRYVEFDLALLAREPATASLFWSVARAAAMAAQPPILDGVAALSAQHGAAVCRALGDGVLHALQILLTALSARRGERTPELLFDESLTILYRVVFLLFAEARGLVPIWHPVYRERYTIGGIVTSLLDGRPCRGIWQAIMAISRLAHAGCRAGELTVTAFNGRLFSPAHSAAFDRTRLDDRVMGSALMAAGSTTVAGAGRTRIAYGDLDVEQLGAVYERVLDYAPDAGSMLRPSATRDQRRSTGSFYTPRAVTEFLVRETLDPLVRGRSAGEILQLRILDPAMGSGAFLVAVCRHLAAAAEDRLVREGVWHEADVTAAERAALRREIAQRCVFGVDLNPMAVQLARLSLWLTSLAADRPLTFLDHHLVAGDSLVGATVDDVLRQPTGGGRSRRPAPLPLFPDAELGTVLKEAVRTRIRLACEPDDSAAIVGEKEKTLAALQAPASPLGRWAAVLDLWCAGWFWEGGNPPGSALFGELAARVLHGRGALPDRSVAGLLDHAAALAARHRFLHWPLAFPEVFADEAGAARADGGFDAVVGNPPWDMVRGDSGAADVRAGRRREARQFTDFIRESGVYRVESGAHANRYQLFVERALQLTRRGGRVGLVLPSGAVADAGAAGLRRHLFDRAEVDRVIGLDNRRGIFPIHRSLRFVLLTATCGRPTLEVRCRFGVANVDGLDGGASKESTIVLPRTLLGRISGADDLGIPELATARDLTIVEKIASRIPPLSSSDGWHVQFGRELNATDDRGAFVPFTGAAGTRPVVEGKQVEPFRVAIERSRLELQAGASTRPIPRRPRLAYRDVASATNRLTLIAAIIPPRAVTTHTLFCLRTVLDSEAQHVLCTLLNSFVANYLVRLRVNTHVTVRLVARLPIPVVRTTDPAFARLAGLSRALASALEPVEEMPAYAELQALVARLYMVTGDEFAHILRTFPLIPQEVRDRAMALFNGTRR